MRQTLYRQNKFSPGEKQGMQVSPAGHQGRAQARQSPRKVSVTRSRLKAEESSWRAKIKEAKAKYDPTNFFTCNRYITPLGADE